MEAVTTDSIIGSEDIMLHEEPGEKTSDEGASEGKTRRNHSEGVIMAIRDKNTIELKGEIQDRKIRILIDSGSSENFISEGLASQLGIELVNRVKMYKLADDTQVKTQGCLKDVEIKCGERTFKETVTVLPQLSFDVIFGIPWLRKYNPAINWVSCQVAVKSGTRKISLPTVESKITVDFDQVNFLTTESEFTVGRVMHVKSELETEEKLLFHEQMTPAIKETLRKFRRVFLSDLPKGPMPIRGSGHEFRIDLEPGTQPIHRPIYKLSPKELEEVKKQLDYLLEKDLIQPSKSPWGAPILFAPKKDGGLRMCLDYRWINKCTIKNRYPLPLPEELIDRLAGATLFSRIDLRSGYWQMPIRKEDREKTAFRSRYGHFEFKVVPFGLCNAPPQFMAMINHILQDELDNCCVVFLDDIIVYSKTAEEHQGALEKVLQKLEHFKLYAKASKCSIFRREVDFVGYWISEKGVQPHRSKVKVILEWKAPKTILELRSFLGMVSYYRKFIRGFSDIASPMHKLLRKDVTWQWELEQQNAFDTLKEHMSEAPLLKLPDSEQKYVVVTDASELALGAVLMQEGEQGLQPLAFWSRALRPTEKLYAAYDREMLGITQALRHWRHYLEGAAGGVEVWTDHLPATYIMKQKDLTRTQVRYMKTGMFQTIDPTIKYIKGPSNVVADALSRNPMYLGTVAAVSTVKIDDEEFESWKEAYRVDDKLSAIIERLQRKENVRGYFINQQGILCIQIDATSSRTVVPVGKQAQIMQAYHKPMIRGHPGVERTFELISRIYWWKLMKKSIKEFVSECSVCQVMKNETAKVKGLLRPIPIPERKWQQVTTDLVTDLPVSNGYTAVAVFVDRLTKYCRFVPCTKEVTAVQYARMFFDNVFRNFGMPESIISDRDPRFTSKFWQELFRLVGVKLKYSTAYHPETDGQSEVTIKTLENLLRPYVEEFPNQWSEMLTAVEFAANNSKNHSTGHTPFYLRNGQNPTEFEVQGETEIGATQEAVWEMDASLQKAKEKLKMAQERMAKAANKKRRNIEFEVGQKVLLKTKQLALRSKKDLPRKLTRRYVGPYEILEKISPVAYKIQLPSTWRIHPTFHISKLKEYKEPKGQQELTAEGALEPTEFEREYEVEAIVGERTRGHRKEYHVKWKGYPSHENTWEPLRNLRNCPQILSEYQATLG